MKKVLYVIAGILALYLILAIIGPKNVDVAREITINKPAAMVKEKLGDFRFFQEKWSPWSPLDPEMKVSYKGNPGEPGHYYEWSGNKKVREGSMEIAEIKGDTIVQNIGFGKNGKEGMSQAYLIAQENNNATTVKWQMHFDIGFLHRPFMLFMNMEKMIGEKYEEGLANLKGVLEGMQEAQTKSYDINEMKWEEKTFASTKRSVMPGEKCGIFFSENWPKMIKDLEKNKIQPGMAPSAIFYSWDEKTMSTDCAAVVNVPNGKVPKGWEKCTVPASKVLHIAYYGDQSKNYEAHMAMEKYMNEKDLKKNIVIEEYVTDPATERDTTKWLTNIYYVLQ
jgi:effector-binding domain-containing protein